MKCRLCSRYVTSYKGTWRNPGTLRKQPCKLKKAKKGKAGKAPQQQKGGALPALPPGSLTRGKQKGACKKPRLTQDRDPVRETLASLHEQIQSDVGTAEASAGIQNLATSTGSSSAFPHQSDADASEVTHGEPVRTSGNKRGISCVPSHVTSDREQLVCMHCLPVVVYDGVQPCGLGCGSSVCARHAHRRTI
eukprot:372895-Amphidinium_carterae.2